MRLLRVALTDVRGVAAADVRFAPDGVTLVEAPNEAGKSTLLDAVDVLFTYKDASRAQRVRDLQPADRDVGSTIEVELTCGPFHLTCTKTYNREPATVLTVHAPTAETLRGEEAHDRLRAILDAEVDLALYEALRFAQGRDLEAVALGASDVLAARLDAAAGGAGAGDDGGLLDRAAAEYGRWFTPTGRPGKALTTVERDLASAVDDHAALAARTAALEQDVTDLETIDRELPTLRQRRTDVLEPRLAAARDAVARVQAARAAVDARRADRAEAATARAAAEAELERRASLIRRGDDLTARHAAMEAALVPGRDRLAALALRRTTADTAVADATAALDTARRRRDGAQLVVDLLVARAERDTLADRHRRVTELLAAARDAETALAAHRLGDAELARIRTAAEAARIATAALTVGAPQLRVRARRDLDLVVDGTIVPVPAGEEVTRTVADRVELGFTDLAAVEVRAGTSADGLHQAVASAEEELRTACAAAGVADPADAERLALARRDHLAAVAQRDAALERELAGGTVDDLTAALRDAEGRVADLTAPGTPPSGPLPDPASARDELAAARAAVAAAEATLARHRAEIDTLAEDQHGEHTRVEVAAAQRDALVEELDGVRSELDRLRAERDDAALTDAVVAARAEEDAAAQALAAADTALAVLDPEAVERDARAALDQLDELLAAIGALEQRRAALQERLRIGGEEGLGERLQAAADRLERVRGEHRRVTARAAAARTLHEELCRAREEAYRTYRAPLADRITAAARALFGGDVEVTLDDELRIVGRTVDGVPLAWEQLSAGTREQLAILAALAAAQLAGTDGVPFVLDDALGYADPERLRRLGAILAATRSAQVIVLTCDGARFRHVTGARTVRLDGRVVTTASSPPEPAGGADPRPAEGSPAGREHAVAPTPPGRAHRRPPARPGRAGTVRPTGPRRRRLNPTPPAGACRRGPRGGGCRGARPVATGPADPAPRDVCPWPSARAALSGWGRLGPARRAREEAAVSHVVVGVDGSAQARAALAWAVGEAEAHGCELRAVFVYPPGDETSPYVRSYAFTTDAAAARPRSTRRACAPARSAGAAHDRRQAGGLEVPAVGPERRPSGSGPSSPVELAGEPVGRAPRLRRQRAGDRVRAVVIRPTPVSRRRRGSTTSSG
jgi:hypothetical protein